MDYEKAYKEALNRAKLLKYNPRKVLFECENIPVSDYIFPELKESEDERIRKALITAVSGTFKGNTLWHTDVTREEALAWLEKRSQTFTKKDVDDACLKGVFDAKHELEKQAKQKPIENAEPKFHVGDWVVKKDGKNFCNGSKTVQFTKTDETACQFGSVRRLYEDIIRLWTIEDAEDGDVLVCPLPKGYEAGEQIFIFKGINSRDYVDDCIEYYCRICKGVFYENKNGYMVAASSPLYPASNEQRNLLFAKMKEAGYEWDSEKKELK